jgi:hypothetical protein
MAIVEPRDLSELETPPPAHLLPYHIALVVDGVVEQVMHFDERLAAVFLSNPTIVQVDLPENGGPNIGWIHNAETGTFSENI